MFPQIQLIIYSHLVLVGDYLVSHDWVRHRKFGTLSWVSFCCSGRLNRTWDVMEVAVLYLGSSGREAITLMMFDVGFRSNRKQTSEYKIHTHGFSARSRKQIWQNPNASNNYVSGTSANVTRQCSSPDLHLSPSIRSILICTSPFCTSLCRQMTPTVRPSAIDSWWPVIP